ncbi:MAG TPA: ComEC/Rec2 family competence protein, partial [Pontiella sp.]
MDFKKGDPLVQTRRPLVGIALSVVVGMMIASFNLLPGLIFFIFSAILLLFVILLRCARFPTAMVFASVSLLSACRFMVSVPSDSSASILHLKPKIPMQDVELIGYVRETPEFRPYRDSEQGVWSLPIRCRALRISGEWQKVRGAVDISIQGYATDSIPQHGSKIQCRGLLRKRNFPGGSEIQMDAGRYEIIPETSGLSLVAMGEQWRRKAAEHLERDIERLPLQQSILKALVLGLRKEVPRETMDAFRRTGALHIFAISGLHVGIVGLLLAVVLKTIGVSRQRFGLWLLPLLFLYVISTGMKSSALRALIMAAVFFVGPMLRCKPDIPSSVA